MLGKHGGYVQGYNVQIACSRNQILLAIELHDNPSDTTPLIPVIKSAQHNCATAGLSSDVAAWLADSGYTSTANFTALPDLSLLVSLTKEYDQTRAPTPPSQDVPAGHRDMAARLASTEGKQLYAAAPSSNPASPSFSPRETTFCWRSLGWNWTPRKAHSSCTSASGCETRSSNRTAR